MEKNELRVQVGTLKYELENMKQERDMVALRHEKELRDLQLKADTDFRKTQVRPYCVYLKITVIANGICVCSGRPRNHRRPAQLISAMHSQRS